ncbi:MAG: DUF3108 domain-containing protein [Alphaproteobacteria bacterium]|nr:DUF3108 domain-containing protein [Alphaproteobacteria bacterium]
MKKFGLFLLCGCLFAMPARAFSVVHDFNVGIGPFDASRTQFSYTLDDKDFQIKSAVETFGLFDALYPFKAAYETSGKILSDGLRTRSYHYQSQTRFNKRSKELVYDDKGNLLYRLSSKNGRKKKVGIAPDDENAGTTDFQTVFAELARQYNKVRFCDSRMQVFDGKRRFDVIFKDEGRENLPPLENSPYAGPAAKCSMYIDKLKNDDDDMLMQISSERPIYFWLMEQDGKPFIARIRIDETPLGALEAYAAKITIKE